MNEECCDFYRIAALQGEIELLEQEIAYYRIVMEPLDELIDWWRNGEGELDQITSLLNKLYEIRAGHN